MIRRICDCFGALYFFSLLTYLLTCDKAATAVSFAKWVGMMKESMYVTRLNTRWLNFKAFCLMSCRCVDPLAVDGRWKSSISVIKSVRSTGRSPFPWLQKMAAEAASCLLNIEDGRCFVLLSSANFSWHWALLSYRHLFSIRSSNMLSRSKNGSRLPECKIRSNMLETRYIIHCECEMCQGAPATRTPLDILCGPNKWVQLTFHLYLANALTESNNIWHT